MTTNTGGPAFPVPETRWPDGLLNNEAVYGMTLRDYFAAKAMQGILSGKLPITKDADPLNSVSKVAYKIADAMLKARAL